MKWKFLTTWLLPIAIGGGLFAVKTLTESDADKAKHSQAFSSAMDQLNVKLDKTGMVAQGQALGAFFTYCKANIAPSDSGAPFSDDEKKSYCGCATLGMQKLYYARLSPDELIEISTRSPTWGRKVLSVKFLRPAVLRATPILNKRGQTNMGFDLRRFSGVMLWIAIIGIIGNQLVFGLTVVSEINDHNDAVAIVHSNKKPDSSEEAIRNLDLSLVLLRDGGKEWTPDYANLFLNPAYPFENMDEWSLLNHLLAWGGIAALMLFLVVRLSTVSRPN